MKNNIRRLADKKGLSVAELARRLEVQPHTLARYARGESEPKMQLAEKVAQALECTVEEVLGVVEVGELSAQGRLACFLSDQQNNLQMDEDGPIERLDLPSDLAGLKEIYAIKAGGRNMEPRFTVGDCLIVHPFEPIREGDTVVIGTQKGEMIRHFAGVSKKGKLILHCLESGEKSEIDAESITLRHRVIRVIFR